MSFVVYSSAIVKRLCDNNEKTSSFCTLLSSPTLHTALCVYSVLFLLWIHLFSPGLFKHICCLYSLEFVWTLTKRTLGWKHTYLTLNMMSLLLKNILQLLMTSSNVQSSYLCYSSLNILLLSCKLSIEFTAKRILNGVYTSLWSYINIIKCHFQNDGSLNIL